MGVHHHTIATCLQEGRQGVETDFEATDEFREAWKMKTRDVLAKAEWRRRKLTKRVSVCIEMACSWLAWMSGGADMHGSDCTAL